jgi:hypothetical protein
LAKPCSGDSLWPYCLPDTLGRLFSPAPCTPHPATCKLPTVTAILHLEASRKLLGSFREVTGQTVACRASPGCGWDSALCAHLQCSVLGTPCVASTHDTCSKQHIGQSCAHSHMEASRRRPVTRNPPPTRRLSWLPNGCPTTAHASLGRSCLTYTQKAKSSIFSLRAAV